MQKLNKTMAISIAIILTISMGASTLLIPNANAHDPTWDISSFAYIVGAPTPIGVGQRVVIMMWVDLPMPNAALENSIRRHDYKLTIVKPDGTSESTNWPYISDPTGVQWFPYTPDQIGNYTLKFEYGGQIYTWNDTTAMRTWTNDHFLPASATTTVTVQQEPLPNPQASYPLPTEYWTRPIEGQNTDWWTISSNWLRGPYIGYGSSTTEVILDISGRYQPDGIGPNSPHIMWSKSIQDGGVVGGSRVGIEGNTYYMGGSYNVRFANAIVMYGRLFYEETYGNSGGGGDYVAVNLRTGEELWRTNTTGIGVPSFGYLYDFDSPNQHGVLPEGLLFTSNFARSYDPSTGRPTTMNVTGVPSGTEVAGNHGEIIRYQFNSAGKWLAEWNSSRAIGASAGTGVGSWYTETLINASLPSCYDWNITLPSLGSGTWTIDRYAKFDNLLILVQGSFGTGPRAMGYGANVTAINLNPTSRGQILWSKYYPPAPNNVTQKIIAVDAVASVFVTEDKETLRLTGYSLTDGSQLWSVQDRKTEFDTLRSTGLTAYGKLFTAGFDGILYARDIKTGQLSWTYGNGGPGNSTNAGLETSYGEYPLFVDVVADGKVYLATTEHSPNSPWYKNVKYRVINASNGKELWTLMGWGTGMYAGGYDVVADGYFVFANMYDMKVYSIGKGPSAIIVEAPKAAIALGSSLVISGTVTDISAGAKQDEQAARFPDGVPAVSDVSQSAWMEYVYMQKPRPMDTTGVPIVLSVVDSNGNYREIGTTTSNADGFFAFNWKPDIEGQYTVYASFAGSESYWPSHAVTSFAVDPAAAAPAPTAAPLQSTADMYFVPAVAGLFAFVAIIGVVIILVLRKRP